MAEGKKKQFKRETGTRALVSLAERACALNENKADRPYPYSIKTLYVFGSYVKGSDRIHDLDVALRLWFKGESEWKEYVRLFPAPYYLDWFTAEAKPEKDTRRYLRNRQYIISFHSEGEIDELLKESKEEKTKLYLIRNGKITDYCRTLISEIPHFECVKYK